jgi:hypothetical protein
MTLSHSYLCVEVYLAAVVLLLAGLAILPRTGGKPNTYCLESACVYRSRRALATRAKQGVKDQPKFNLLDVLKLISCKTLTYTPQGLI